MASAAPLAIFSSAPVAMDPYAKLAKTNIVRDRLKGITEAIKNNEVGQSENYEQLGCSSNPYEDVKAMLASDIDLGEEHVIATWPAIDVATSKGVRVSVCPAPPRLLTRTLPVPFPPAAHHTPFQTPSIFCLAGFG